MENYSASMNNTCTIKAEWMEHSDWPKDDSANPLCDFSNEELIAMSKPLIQEAFMIPCISVYSFLFLFGLIANVIIIRAMCCDRQVKSGHNVTNQFLVSLAFADFFFLLICAPYEALIKYTQLLFVDKTGVYCKAVAYVEMVTTCASVWNLTAVSIERYVVIVHPFTARIWFTRTKSTRLILLVWLVSAILSLPGLFIWRIETVTFYNHDLFVTGYYCNPNNKDRMPYNWYRLVILLVVPSILMVFCYTNAIHVLLLSTRNHNSLGVVSHERKKMHQLPFKENGEVSVSLRNSKEQSTSDDAIVKITRDSDVISGRKQVIRMLVVVIVLFLISWSPKLIVDVAKVHSEEALIFIADNHAFYLILISLPYFQSALNPIIYFVMSRRIRQSIIQSFNYVSCNRNSSNAVLSNTSQLQVIKDFKTSQFSTQYSINTSSVS